MVKHKKARSFKISKLKNLLEKPWNPSEVTSVYDPSKSPASQHHNSELEKYVVPDCQRHYVYVQVED